MSELALALIRAAKEKQSTFLDLGNCGLTELPAELFELVDLEVLCLCTEGVYYDESQKLVDVMTENEGTSNDIHCFPPEMRQLAKLKVLLANGDFGEKWQLNDLSPLRDLANLQTLHINNTQVSDLSPLKALVNLQTLHVHETEVRDLSPLKDLVNLQKLFIYKTQVSDLSPLQDLVNLQTLLVHDTQVSDLSPMQDLVSLQTLDVSETQASDLSPLQDLVNLQTLDVSETQVSDLSPLKTIIEKGMPVTWDRDIGLEDGIYVQDCPLTNPPIAITKEGNEAILRYWKEQERSGTRKVNEARLLLVGQGGAGKTTLKDKLKDAQAPMPEPDATTRGINIEPIQCQSQDGDNFTVNIWDFGGQNIQHYAHQFFMSDSVVYAVLSNTREQNANFQYWLNIIELLGKSSPFFIVQNEKDGHTEGLKEIVKIQERFPETFQSVEQVNLKNAASDRRFVALKEKLFHSATQLPHTQKEVINSFFNIREKLATLSTTEPTIPFATFRQYCREEGIEDKNLMNDYALMMTELGIALYYPDDVHLKNTVFLSPKWLIDALFKLLYHPSLEAQHGQFTSAEADAIWAAPEYEDKHGLLILVLEKFRLCYKTRGDTYIVPQRLPLRQEAFVPPADSTHLIYQYKFLPSGFLTQLTCELHDKIEAEKVWSDAVQFVSKDGQGRVFARENNQDHKIELFGFGTSKADLLNRAVEVIDEIHAHTKFKNLVVDKLVPCPCVACKKDDLPHFFKYEVLKRRLQNGKTKTECEKSDEELYIAVILKNANIQAVTMTEIRGLIAQYKPQEAVNLLKGLYPNEWAQMSSRLSHLSHTDRSGTLAHAEKSQEYNKWAQDFLGIAADLLG